MPAANPTETPIPGRGGVKHVRVHLRMDGRTKRTLERAAAYEATTVSRFVLSSAIAAAEHVIESKERVVLPASDWDAFHSALLDAPEPNAVLKAAARRAASASLTEPPAAPTDRTPYLGNAIQDSTIFDSI